MSALEELRPSTERQLWAPSSRDLGWLGAANLLPGRPIAVIREHTPGHAVSRRRSLSRGRLDATMDVGDWLRSLGLAQYETAFRESEIEADVLPELTDQHLKDLGVSLGHRLKILRAIREIGGDAPGRAQPSALAEPSAGNSPRCSSTSSARPRFRRRLIPKTLSREFLTQCRELLIPVAGKTEAQGRG
jgi:hypothetical protein